MALRITDANDTDIEVDHGVIAVDGVTATGAEVRIEIILNWYEMASLADYLRAVADEIRMESKK